MSGLPGTFFQLRRYPGSPDSRRALRNVTSGPVSFPLLDLMTFVVVSLEGGGFLLSTQWYPICDYYYLSSPMLCDPVGWSCSDLLCMDHSVSTVSGSFDASFSAKASISSFPRVCASTVRSDVTIANTTAVVRKPSASVLAT